MPQCGTGSTRLIVLRGNSASGKSTVARLVRERYGRGMAIIGQDVVRREILWEKEEPTRVNIGMIDLMARHALDRGMHVIVEGILSRQSYGAMLDALCREHRGMSTCFYFDVPFEETVRRHATKPQAAEYGAPEMQAWYRPLDLVPELDEYRIDASSALENTIDLVIARSGLEREEHAPDATNRTIAGSGR